MSFRLANIFTDHMILQRDVPVKIWGEANCPVTVSIDTSNSTAYDRDGTFSLDIAPHMAGGPYTMIVECGGEVLKFNDVYYGDVYLAGGQSNMATTLSEAIHPIEESDSVVRMFTPDREWEYSKRPETDDRWVDVSRKNENGISAVASYFATNIARTQKVPVGIVSCSQSASCIRSWISPESVADDPIFGPDTKWHEDADDFPFNAPSHQYNERLVQLAPYPLKGVIWYQGESDTSDPIVYSYKHLFEIMVEDWRRLWNDPELPFITVQLTAYRTNSTVEMWEVLREQQLLASESMYRVGMITIGDVGDLNDIHPKDKRTVGDRLALYARGMIYGENVLFRPPICRCMSKSGDTAVLFFSDVGDGLYESESLKFEVLDSDGRSYDADYEIDVDTVRVRAVGIDPQEIRFCFDSSSEVHLYSSVGLPASPFRIRL